MVIMFSSLLAICAVSAVSPIVSCVPS